MVVLIFTGFYLPGFKGGGPIRTIANMVEAFGDEVQFSIVTLDRDLGDTAPYPNIKPDAWQPVGKAMVYYAMPPNGFHQTLKVIRDFQGDVLYLNSFFSFRFSILPLLIARWVKPAFEVFVAPRGEFSEGALALKSTKKQVWLALAKAFGLYEKVIWLASTAHEAEDIRRVMGKTITVRTAINIAAPAANINLKLRKEGAPLQVIFISRISPKKNLLGAIEMLKKVQFPVDFHVYGPAEDSNYLNACQSAASSLPTHVSLQTYGPLQPEAIAHKMAEYDLFFLPTLGENFGHVIAEALSSGLPVLISDQTPWRDLENKELGWDLPLLDPGAFARCIETCHTKPAVEYNQWRQKIRAWALQNIGNHEAIEQNRQIFMNLKASNEH
ncbi:MAG: glycosyltransferase [Hydrogenophaga sp.]|uniref:glycosyltransferase n=1 Tax=Hydrogenophaga sp. TaxID=1904254 RepID=UPI002ABB7BFF|nr:glycosyltransferase [Hydrogenophaga sp.]MDZ4190364.1 glycosyltransferase [Hydrogenophaga sp.]